MSEPQATGYPAATQSNENPEGAPVARQYDGGPTVSVLAMLAALGATVGLWAGARRHVGPVARGYRWLGGTALFWFAGLIVAQVLGGPLSTSPGLADVAPLLA